MRLGLGLSICDVRRAGISYVDPATEELSGWWRAAFGGSPWEGVASADGSGTRDLTEAVTPPSVGAAVNGRATADFNGTSILSGANLSEFVTAGAGSLWCLFFARTAPAAVGGGSIAEPYEQHALVGLAGAGHLIMVFNEDGVTAAIHDGGYKAVSVAAAPNTWHLAQMRWDSTALQLSVDGSPFASASVAAGAVGHLASAVRLGTNYAGARFFDGLIADVGFKPVAESDESAANRLAYVRGFHGVLT